jgi:GNAT superfamily N-acetyltransferase
MIRVATVHDLPALVSLGAFLHDESPRFRQRSFDPVKCGEHLKMLIDGAGVVFVADHHGVVVGAFAGGIAVDWYGHHKTAFDYSIMVHPTHRQGILAVRLLTAFKVWAKEMGADCVQCGITTGIKPQETARLYQALGFELIGQLFEQEV